MEEIRAQLASSIRRARLRQGVTQGDLAGRLGVDRSQISDWEQAKQTPRLDMAIALARALGVTVDQLLSGEEPSSDAERMADFDRRLRELTETVKDLVRRFDEGRASRPRSKRASQK